VRLIQRLVIGLATLALVAFAVVNRQRVELWPLPDAPPLGLALVVALLVGFAAGMAAAWLAFAPRRREARHRARRIEALERELAATQDRLTAGPDLNQSGRRPADLPGLRDRRAVSAH